MPGANRIVGRPALVALMEEPVEERIAALESDVAHIKSDIQEIKSDIRELRGVDIRELRAADSSLLAAIAALRHDMIAGDAALREGLVAVRGEIRSVALETRLWMILILGAIASSVLGFVAHAMKWI